MIPCLEMAERQGGAASQGVQTSATLMDFIREGVAQRVCGVSPGADKTTHLVALAEAHGPGAVVDLGLGLCRLPDNPVFAVITAGETAPQVLQRWIRLERYGHSRNRTRVVSSGRQSNSQSMGLEHFATDGGPLHPLNDLFIWGVLVALLQRAGFVGVVGSVGTKVLVKDGLACLGGLPAVTTRLGLTWRSRRMEPSAYVEVDSSCGIPARLGHLLNSDLVRSWSVANTARALGLSTRALQRALCEQSTSFSEMLQRCRVDAARERMSDPKRSLTEIAFCTGFSDLAHFSRLFHRYLEVPPSAFRELLLGKTRSTVG